MLYRGRRFTSRVPLRYSSRHVDTATIEDPAFWERARAESQAAIAEQRRDEPENWPQSRQLAILMIHRSSIALDCMAHLSGQGIRARQHDFAYLRNHGYATKELAGKYHKLTPMGRRAAKAAASALGLALGLHHSTIHFDSWSEHRIRCCCGWSQSVNRRANANAAERLQAAFDEHLKNPEDWKRRVLKAQEIIDKVGTETLALFRKTPEVR